MIELGGLTKRYRSRVAVDGLTVTIHPGRVTGFLGPNGSGTPAARRTHTSGRSRRATRCPGPGSTT